MVPGKTNMVAQGRPIWWPKGHLLSRLFSSIHLQAFNILFLIPLLSKHAQKNWITVTRTLHNGFMNSTAVGLQSGKGGNGGQRLVPLDGCSASLRDMT